VAVQNARLYQTAVDEKEQTNTILQRAFAGILVVDPELRILTTNRSTETITGYAEQELVGKRLPDIFEPELWAAESVLQRSIQTGLPTSPVEITLRGKHEPRDVLLGVTPLRDGYLLNFTDITRLKEVDRLKSNIVSNVSHELRTPLASIKAYTELLLDEVEGGDRALRMRFLSVIDSEADRLAQFINDLLDLSRLQSGRMEGQTELMPLDTLVAEVAKSLDIQAQMAGVTIRLDFPPGLPPIRANKDLMRSMSRNLIGNAIKYSPKGGEVRVAAHATEDRLILDVIDQGIGIPPEDLPQLFTRFYRSWIARQSGIRGTGLGLVVAKEAVELHGGTIAVESQVGVGTRFSVTLPIPTDVSATELSPALDARQGDVTWAKN
jgi:PAS domain S-box-containing protein